MGRFINSDSLEYLGDGAELSNYNLFAYCDNNPVMGSDPEGTLNGVNLFASIIVAVAITGLCVATAGLGAAIVIGGSAVTSAVITTGIGCTVAAATTIIDSAIENDCEELNPLDVAYDTFLGGFHAATNVFFGNCSGSIMKIGGKLLVNYIADGFGAGIKSYASGKSEEEIHKDMTNAASEHLATLMLDTVHSEFFPFLGGDGYFVQTINDLKYSVLKWVSD